MDRILFMRGFRYLQKLLSAPMHLRTTARCPQHNDVYIVEFPKSGITWLSALLANSALIESGRNELASYTATHLYVPDIHLTRDIGPMPYDKPPVRMIKSHSAFNPNYPFVIYLVRHPISVMQSYYRYDKEGANLFSGSFEDFCFSESLGIPAWKRHVNSWLCGKIVMQRIHLCRYEDLMKDPVKEVSDISNNFGWSISRSSIEKAAERSTKERMKADELAYAERNPGYTREFIGGSGMDHITKSLSDFVSNSCSSELSLLGYHD